MDEISKTLLLIIIECCIAEKQRLTQWVLDSKEYNQTMMDAVLACKQHFQEISQHQLFDTLSGSIKQEVNCSSQILSKLYARMKQLISMSENESDIIFQIPCPDDLLAMHSLCAGAKDSQKQRLGKISKILHCQLDDSLLITTKSAITSCWLDRLPWQVLCQAIRRNDLKLAEAAFNAIPKDNLLLKALLKAHSESYLLSLVSECAALKKSEIKEIDQDVICGHLTFEVLINDLITTLEQRRQINICFGLPTHHAYSDKAAGFCLINKVAVVMAYEQLTAAKPFQAVIIGMDVNRDDGLNAILMAKDYDQPFTHIDIYDSRVYPWHDVNSINEQLQRKGQQQEGMMIWQEEAKCYISIDLANNLRKGADYHPALLLALSKLEVILEEASRHQGKVIIFLPTGWDSHYQEKAPCGQWINQQRMLNQKQSIQCRFTDEDLSYFNEQIMTLYQCYQSTILRLYWQLEGGYTDAVNARQIENLTTVMQAQHWLNANQLESCSL